MTLDVLLSRLDKVKRRGNGKYLACCPSHDDSDPSLAISTDNGGKILIHCFAGCQPAEILSAIDLEMADLFSDDLLTKHRKLIHYEQKNRRNKASEVPAADQKVSDQLVLGSAKEKRAKGDRLSEREMNLELEAYLRTRGSDAIST
jgi:DNA primase